MAFLQASPTKTTRPICTKMFTEVLVYSTPMREQSKHNGTTRMTANGSVQLSYKADSARNTNTTARPKTMPVVLPSLICMNISSVHSAFMDRGKDWDANLSTPAITSPELTPGSKLPVTGADA